MTNAKVTGLRGVELGVRDLHQSAAFYSHVWGLEPVGRSGDTIRLRGNGAEHHVVTLRERPTPGLLGVHFAVTDRDAVETVNSPTVSSTADTPTGAGVRRSTERTRNASSRGLNGLVR